jgi:hypothetical protein
MRGGGTANSRRCRPHLSPRTWWRSPSRPAWLTLADWVAATARVRVEPAPVEVALPDGCAGIVTAVENPGRLHNLALKQPSSDSRGRARVAAVLRRLIGGVGGGRVVASTACCTVHLSVEQPDLVRARLRPLARDGLLHELPLLSAESEAVCDDPRCTCSGW